MLEDTAQVAKAMSRTSSRPSKTDQANLILRSFPGWKVEALASTSAVAAIQTHRSILCPCQSFQQVGSVQVGAGAFSKALLRLGGSQMSTNAVSPCFPLACDRWITTPDPGNHSGDSRTKQELQGRQELAGAAVPEELRPWPITAFCRPLVLR